VARHGKTRDFDKLQGAYKKVLCDLLKNIVRQGGL
jgi:hypothetical protein